MTKGEYMTAVKRTNIRLGLFALQDIPAGQRIIEYTGPLIPIEAVEGRKFGKYFLVIIPWRPIKNMTSVWLIALPINETRRSSSTHQRLSTSGQSRYEHASPDRRLPSV